MDGVNWSIGKEAEGYEMIGFEDLYKKEGKEIVDRVIAFDCLETMGRDVLGEIISKMHKVLKVGGKLSIRVIDFKQVVDRYLNGLCSCYINHKANPECMKCGGKATISPEKVREYIYGKPFKSRMNIFDTDYIIDVLKKTGFEVKELAQKDLHIEVYAAKRKRA